MAIGLTNTLSPGRVLAPGTDREIDAVGGTTLPQTRLPTEPYGERRFYVPPSARLDLERDSRAPVGRVDAQAQGRAFRVDLVV